MNAILCACHIAQLITVASQEFHWERVLTVQNLILWLCGEGRLRRRRQRCQTATSAFFIADFRGSGLIYCYDLILFRFLLASGRVSRDRIGRFHLPAMRPLIFSHIRYNSRNYHVILFVATSCACSCFIAIVPAISFVRVDFLWKGMEEPHSRRA